MAANPNLVIGIKDEFRKDLPPASSQEGLNSIVSELDHQQKAWRNMEGALETFVTPSYAAGRLGVTPTPDPELSLPQNEIGRASEILRSVPAVERSQISGHPHESR